MCVNDYYQSIIRELMAKHGVEPGDAPYIVSADATFACVLRHTDRYIGKGHDDQPGNKSHYRYNRYRNILQHLPISDKRIAHVDIGCGAGLFSWVFLDWVTRNRIEHDRVDLCGFDHSSAMLKLAGVIRDKLTQSIGDYPDTHYHYDTDALLEQLSYGHRGDMDYIITFGHVLVQAHTPDAIASFTRIIRHVVELMRNQSKCHLVAVDAVFEPIAFEMGWESLLSSLEQAGIGNQLHINGENAKYASLYRA